ncbi:MAG: hypothetical protein K9J06_14800 [Flavobacteriales bacterium]|nr:hypothetical protein [Flavobacteriales bacterium]
MSTLRILMALMMVMGLHQGMLAQERTKDKVKAGTREVENDTDKAAVKTERAVDKAAVKTERVVLKAADKTERAVDKAAVKTERVVLKAADKTERAVDKAAVKTERVVLKAVDKVEKAVVGNRPEEQRSKETRSREELNTTLDEHDRKAQEARERIRVANEKLETDRKAGKVSPDEYRERKEKIAKAERGVKDLERKVDEGRRTR